MAFRPIHETQQALNTLQEEMNRMFERVWHGGISTPPFNGQAWAPAIDLHEFDDRFVLLAEAPGLSATDVEITHVGNVLTLRGEKRKPSEMEGAVAVIRGERRYGVFCRSLELPAGADADRMSAKCQMGVIELTIPKSEASKPKSVKIAVEPG
ncbi:MAG: Hsp20/alpha crystallin family protein [Planctomycetota bacterium]